MLFSVVPMSARKRPAASDLPQRISPAQRQSLQKDLVRCTTTIGLIQAMSALHKAGVLENGADFKPRQLSKELTAAKKQHSNVNTPYGRVVQALELPTGSGNIKWDICHPMAFVHYLCSLSIPFFDLMRSTILSSPGGCLSVILERPEARQRAHNAGHIYWSFAEWPAWLLARTGAWPVLGVLRSKVASQIVGGISALIVKIMKIFFPAEGCSFIRGIMLRASNSESIFMKASFGGYLADEKALKEICDCKGASGTMPCMKCGNVLAMSNSAFLQEGVVCINCTDREKFSANSNEIIFQIVDDLAAIEQRKKLELMETEWGFNRNEHGILRCMDLRERGIISPRDNYIEEDAHVCFWMPSEYAYSLTFTRAQGTRHQN